MQNVPRKAPHNPADPLAVSYMVQLIGDLSSARSRSHGSLGHNDSITGREDDTDGAEASADASEQGGTGYFAQLPERITWKRLLSFCLPGTYPNSTY